MSSKPRKFGPVESARKTNKRSTTLPKNNLRRKSMPEVAKINPRHKTLNSSSSVHGLKSRAIAKFPTSREDASSNWKALLLKQGKPLPVFKASSQSQAQTGSKTQLHPVKDKGKQKDVVDSPSLPSLVTTPDQRQKIMMTDSRDACAGAGAVDSSISYSQKVKQEFRALGVPPSPSQKVKQEFRALGLSDPQQSCTKPKFKSRSSSRGHNFPKGYVKRVPIPDGLNEMGYFDYNHYGVLRTPLTPAHSLYMQDTEAIAMDCEMVGVGMMKESALARVSIVNEYGYCLYDAFVKPKLEITDYRTQFSGIREEDMNRAIPFQVAIQNVASLLKNHILVGHSLKSDMSVLFLNHPKIKTRDTAVFFQKMFNGKTPKLKTLAKKILNVNIQEGEHSSITDAQAAMAIYQLYQPNWESSEKYSESWWDTIEQHLEIYEPYYIDYESLSCLDCTEDEFWIWEEEFY